MREDGNISVYLRSRLRDCAERLTRSERMSDTCLSNQLPCRDWRILCDLDVTKKINKKPHTVTPDSSVLKYKALLRIWKGITHAYTDTHISDNGITSSVRRVIVLDSDERGMSRNTFSFPLREKLWGRRSCLDSMVCVQGKTAELDGGNDTEGEKTDDDVIG